MEEPQVQKFKLKENTELRIESEPNSKVTIQLDEGSAEVFGSELQLGNSVDVSGKSIAVYTWSECLVTVTGNPTMIYEAAETPMASYLNVHEVLQQRRKTAHAAGGCCRGPRVLLAGPTDSGKSSISKMLINWAVRANWEPTYVDLDIGQNSITIPGCVAAVVADTQIDLELSFEPFLPLVFFYGNASPETNPQYYKKCVENLAAVLEKRCDISPEAAAAGYIINTMGFIEKLGYDLLRHAIVALKVDVVLVVNNDRLQAQFTTDFGVKSGSNSGAIPRSVMSSTEEPLPALSSPPTLVKLFKSGGVVERSTVLRRRTREDAVHRYFYGYKGELRPVLLSTAATQLSIFKIGSISKIPSAVLPIGAKAVVDPLALQPVAPGSMDLIQSVMAVSNATAADQVATSSVAGFVLVKEINTAKGMVSYTSPAPMTASSKYFVLGSMRSNID